MKITSVAYRFLSPGAVVRAYVPFADGEDMKARPVVVVGMQGQEVTVIPCSTSRRATRSTDVAIEDLDSAGLPKSTRARTARCVVLERSAVIKLLGHLEASMPLRILPAIGHAA